MKQKCIKFAFIFAILTAVFDVVSIGFAIPLYITYYSGYISIIIGIIGVISTVLFIIGLKKENPVLMGIKFGYGIITSILRHFIYIDPSHIYSHIYYDGNYSVAWVIICEYAVSLSAIMWSLVLLFVVIALFKETANKPNAMNPLAVVQPENKDRTGMLLEYKNLLDMGAITQEEFDEKKKELLGL